MLASLLLAAVSQFAPATVDMNEEEFRLYCGYLDVLSKPDIQKLPETKRNKNRLHFDLEVADFATDTRRAAELGGQQVSAVHTLGQPWQVWADREGNEFCLITAD